jgi:hypothetical protein
MNVDINKQATGAFPPLYVCEKEKRKQDEDDKVNRGFSKIDKDSVASIKDIMTQRREGNDKPFISLD